MGSVQRRTATATIAINTALSGAVDLGHAALCAIEMPTAWTTAALTFQGSHDGVTYQNIYDANGEMSIASTIADASRDLALNPVPVNGWRPTRPATH